MTRALGRLTIAHLLVNAVLLTAGYFWLGIGENRGLSILLSALFALLLLAAACWTYGATFAFFGSAERGKVSAAWRTAARNVPALGAAAVGIAIVYWLLSLWQDYSSNPAFTLASFLTLTFRKPVTPASALKVFDAVLAVVRWGVLPAALLPMLAAISTRGWSGFAAIGRRMRRWWFWIAAPLLVLCALWVPLELLDWRPRMSNFAMETVSFVLRAMLAYLLFGVGWLVLAFATWAGKPRLTQSNTAVSP